MFTLKYSKKYNLFFFVSQLTSWHYSYKKSYKDAWLRNQPLSKREEAVLKKMALILKKHGFGDNYPGRLFLRNKKASQNQPKIKISSRKQQLIKNYLNLFEKRFDKIWKEELNNLKFWKGEIAAATNQKKFKNAIKLFQSFLGSQKKQRINVLLMISPLGLASGGQALFGTQFVFLECGGALRNKTHKKKLISILMHETIHILQRDHLDDLIEKYINANQLMKEYPNKWPELYQQKWGPKSLFRETIASVLPMIVLSNNHIFPRTKIQNRSKTTWEAIDYSIRKNQSVINKYVLSNKQADQRLLEIIWKNFQGDRQGDRH